MEKGYKQCPFCANEIKEGAKKCQYCHEFLDKDDGLDKDESKKGLIINNEKQIKSCINTGRKRTSRGRLSIILPIFIFLSTIALRSGRYSLTGEEYHNGTTIVGFAILALIWVAIYFLVWLIKNYRVLLNSKIEGLACKSYFLLLLYWICPIINLFKPQLIMEDLLKNFLNNVGENYNSKLIKRWGIFRDITLASLILMFCYPKRLSAIAIGVYIVAHGIHTFYLIKIINKIVFVQEIHLNNRD